jgi:hypothetical protein
MSNHQFIEAMVVASVLNTGSVVAGIVINVSKLRELRTHVDALFDQVDRCFDQVLGPEPASSRGAT